MAAQRLLASDDRGQTWRTISPDLTFPATFKASLKMKTEQGEVLSGFDMNLVKTGPIQKKDSNSGVYKVKIDEWVKGDINGGGPEFTMKNYNGDIIIRKK